MDLSDPYQNTSLATQYDFACFRLSHVSVTFTLASLYSSGITFSSKYLHVCYVSSDNVASHCLKITYFCLTIVPVFLQMADLLPVGDT